MSRQILALGIVAALLVGMVSATSSAAMLDATQSLNAGATLQLTGTGGDQDVAPQGGIWDFGDRFGNDTNTAVDPPGMDMNGYALSTTDNTDIILDLNGGDIDYTGGNVLSLDTRRTADMNFHTGDIGIRNAGEIEIGTIVTDASGRRAQPGGVEIGLSGDPVGDVVVRQISTRGRTGSDSTQAGPVTVYSSGDVTVSTSILAISGGRYGTNFRRGNVKVYHDGALSVDDIDTSCLSGSDYAYGGDIVLSGDQGSKPRGDCSLGDLNTSATSGNRVGPGTISISGYASVSTGSIDTSHEFGWTNYGVGNVTITDITGNIDIDGAIDLEDETDPGDSGNLTLTAGGNITLASLDLDLLDTAVLNAGGDSFIVGALKGFDTGSPGNGELDSSGSVFYDPGVMDNGYLSGLTYSLASGGELAPVPEPTTLAMLLCGALGLMWFGRRKR
jgi:hypothetical protein